MNSTIVHQILQVVRSAVVELYFDVIITCFDPSHYPVILQTTAGPSACMCQGRVFTEEHRMIAIKLLLSFKICLKHQGIDSSFKGKTWGFQKLRNSGF